MVEGLDGIADRLLVAPQVVGNLWSAFPSSAGQEDLAAAQDEGIGRAPAPPPSAGARRRLRDAQRLVASCHVL
ncbi:MAG TPA: hypothetical protein VFA32_03895 [Dehalococcoidia bacterium]|nr:hypothetical protein [Dehalococcoidia bacterium]